MPVAFETSATAFVLSGASISVPKPPGLSVNDLLLAFVLKNVGGVLGTWTTPALWAEFDRNHPGGVLQPKVVVASKFADAADVVASSFTFSHSDVSSTNLNGVLLRISGACGIQLGFSVARVADIPIATMTAPDAFAAKDNSLVIRALFFDFVGTEPSSVIAPAGVTLAGDSVGPMPPLSSDSQIHVYTDDALKTPPGLVGTRIFTPVGFTGNEKGVHYTLLIEPAPSGGGSLGIPLPPTEPEVIERAILIKNPFKNRFDQDDRGRM